MTDLHIYDFDQTITKKHTFGTHCIENYADKETETIYAKGVLNAETNIKVGFRELFKHDELQTSAIATYHNNPAYIAGNIAALLSKKLTLVETRHSKAPTVAIDIYAIEGTDKPFLISYIPETYEAFQKRLNEVQGKNDQILFLQETLLKLGQIHPNTLINFYDDSKGNYEKAQLLPQVNSFHINANNPSFQIIASKINAAAPTLVEQTEVEECCTDCEASAVQENQETPDVFLISSKSNDGVTEKDILEYSNEKPVRLVLAPDCFFSTALTSNAVDGRESKDDLLLNHRSVR